MRLTSSSSESGLIKAILFVVLFLHAFAFVSVASAPMNPEEALIRGAKEAKALKTPAGGSSKALLSPSNASSGFDRQGGGGGVEPPSPIPQATRLKKYGQGQLAGRIQANMDEFRTKQVKESPKKPETGTQNDRLSKWLQDDVERSRSYLEEMEGVEKRKGGESGSH
ncbi:hypothetical protein IE53DRAFT_366044 [Violaceomyces palustris]|uniref:Uncharacterized protein n=1 Tax=Violaceomyces palustris TaxID=1673888 RepID=A0ACD0P6R0_9BASI|nr:hypothetical protein IE53DRAFT_366044 [Violaceomyces palustris]